jgi:methionyl-tRNA formyltransferase
VKLRDGTFAAWLQSLAPDLAVVVAYGRILPPDVLAIPRLGAA